MNTDTPINLTLFAVNDPTRKINAIKVLRALHLAVRGYDLGLYEAKLAVDDLMNRNRPIRFNDIRPDLRATATIAAETAFSVSDPMTSVTYL